MAEKLLQQIIELYEQIGGNSDGNAARLCSFYDVLEFVVHRLAIVESMNRLEKNSGAAAA